MLSPSLTSPSLAHLLVRRVSARVFHADWRALVHVAPSCDLLLVDAPYSEKTHAGHGDGVQATRPYQKSDGSWRAQDNQRRDISYDAWTATDVDAFVEAWHPRTSGWFVSITDDVLMPAWQAALRAAGRYVFAPLPYVAPGSRVRLAGDGPSSWTTWIVVARPRTKEAARWGTLPGAYVLPKGQGGKLPVVGGKPVWLIQRLIEDYSRPGDLVVDPCCGAGTTAVAAMRTGRRAVVGDVSREHAELAAAWVDREGGAR